MTFAPEKTQTMVFSRSPAAKSAIKGKMGFDGVPLPLQETVKILGVEVDRELQFDSHIKHSPKGLSQGHNPMKGGRLHRQRGSCSIRSKYGLT